MTNNKLTTSFNKVLQAIYIPAIEPEYSGNPLIEALPPFAQASSFISEFGKFPNIADDDKKLSITARILAIGRLNNYLEPLPHHITVIDRIGLNIRDGYKYRKPQDCNYYKERVNLYREAMGGKIRVIEDLDIASVPCFALFGVSGTGKTSVITRTLSLLPRALRHNDHMLIQVVWLKVDCPADGSLKNLLTGIIYEFDKVLGTSHIKEVGSHATTDRLILHIAKLSSQYSLGLLVIDEIQFLLKSNPIGQDKLLDFLVSLVNVCRIPLVLVGTPSARSLLENKFRLARRVSDFGIEMWDKFQFDDSWELFVSGLWEYQLTQNYTELTADISKTLYDLTIGIPALVVRLFQLSQVVSLYDGSDKLSCGLLKSVAKDKLRLVQPIIDLMKSKRFNHKKYPALYDDMLCTNISELESDVVMEMNKAALKLNRTSRIKENVERRNTINELLIMGYNEDDVQVVVDYLFKQFPEINSADAVANILKDNIVTRQVTESNSRSLCDIVSEAKSNNVSTADALSSAGILSQ